MSYDPHLSFNRQILVDKKLAAECVKDDSPYFVAAYHALFPEAKIEVMTAFALAKQRKKEKDEREANEQAQAQE